MRGLRMVICSDLHTDRRTAGVDRFDEIARAARQSVRAAVGCDLWVFLGDLCEPEDGYELGRALELLVDLTSANRRHGVRSVLLAGNHDVDENGKGRTTLSALRPLADDMLRIYERPGACIVGDVYVVALPYPPVGGFDMRKDAGLLIRAFGEFANVRTGVVLAHATHISGAREGEETLEMPRGRAVELPLDVVPRGWACFNGHYHTPQTTPGGVVIPGALARLTRGEAKNEPRFIQVEV